MCMLITMRQKQLHIDGNFCRKQITKYNKMSRTNAPIYKKACGVKKMPTSVPTINYKKLANNMPYFGFGTEHRLVIGVFGKRAL